jgi:hypothetical protein
MNFPRRDYIHASENGKEFRVGSASQIRCTAEARFVTLWGVFLSWKLK